jgi:hypothetical protein
MEKTALYLAIDEYLTSKGFSAPNENCPAFRCKVIVPGRIVVINGQRMKEEPQTAVFDITPLGKGAILNDNGPDTEIQGYNIGHNDIWVDSLEDFKFWLEKATRGDALAVSE